MHPDSGPEASLPELFARAVELDDAGREVLLRDLAATQPTLADELAQLLSESGAATGASPLDRSPWHGLGGFAASAQPLPDRIAGYRILRELGRGGMGRVFLAEEQKAEFRRTVALKVIDRPGFDGDAVRRFREEVRILSALEHPGIARFLDGGRAEDGTLFLALEYVEGSDLLLYAAERSLSARQRVELFLAALDAVGYAHGKGVVHRDLKPGHLLVGADGRPRLLDFGISKLVDPETHASASETRTESRALTPAYASPEQYRGEPVTTASDVYSLGVVLYELLAGRRPFGAATGTALERAVLDEDPEPPSTAVRRTATHEEAAATASSPALRRGALRRDLDAICLKALRKQPGERYPDARSFADDLRRYLDGRPVEARRGGWRYRFGRLIYRRRAALALAAAMLLAAGSAFVAWRAQRQVAQLRPAEPEPRPFPFSEAVRLPIEELQRRFAARPADVEAGAAYTIALIQARRLDEAKLIVARLRQIPDQAGDPVIDYVEAMLAVEREEPQRGLVLYTQARDRAIEQGRGELVAQVRALRGRLLATLGQRDEARREMELAVRDFATAGDHESLSGVLNDLAIEHLQQGRLDEGSALLRRGMEEGRLAGVTKPPILMNLGILETFLGRPDRALEPLVELVAYQRRSQQPAREGQALGVLAHVYFDLGRTAEAEAAFDEAIALMGGGGDPLALRSAIEARALMDVELARWDRLAEALRGLETRAPGAGEFNPAAWIARLRALAAAAQGDSERMRREFAVARTLLLENGDVDQAAEIDAAQALAEWRAGRDADARRLAEEAIRRLPEGNAAGEPAVIATSVLARVAVAERRLEEARGHLATLGDAMATSPSVPRRLQFLAARAALARAEARFDDARRDLADAVAVAASSRRKVDELELRCDLVELEIAAGATEQGRSTAAALSAEAASLGLAGVAARSARLADGTITGGSVRPAGN